MFDTAKNSLIKYPGGKTDNYYILPKSVTSINSYAFSACPSLENIYYCGTDEELKNISNYDKISNLVSLHNFSDWQSTSNPSCTTDGEKYRICSICNEEETAIIPATHSFENDLCTACGISFNEMFTYTVSNGEASITDCDIAISNGAIPSVLGGYPVTKIAAEAFLGCKGMTSLTLPKSVTVIDEYAFAFCNSLSEIIYDGTRYDWSKIDIGVGNQKLHGAKINYTYSSPSTGLKIEWKEASSSYYDNYRGYFVTGIGTCTDTDIILPETYNGEKIIGITESAFEGNENITSVYIPSTIHYINKRAFANCKNLVSAEVHAYVNDTGYFSDRGYAVFSGCSSLEFFYTVDIEIRTEYSSGYYKYCPIGFWFGGYYENSTACTQLYYDTNSATTKNATYYFPNSLKTIQLGGYDFESYTGEGYTYAFAGCTTIDKVILEYGISAIPNDTFYHMSGLENIIIPNSVKTIGSSAFSGCSGLTNISIPDAVTNIYSSTFNNCTGLTSIIIPDGIVGIGNNAFNGCDHLETVYYCGTQENWNNISIGSSNDSLISATRNYHKYFSVTTPPVCTENGYTTHTCEICQDSYIDTFVEAVGTHNFENGNCIYCEALLESEHNYPLEYDNTWIIKRDNALSITISFSAETKVEEKYDFIYIYDSNDNEIGKYTGAQLSSQSVTVSGDTVKIRLYSDRIIADYGFKLTEIAAKYIGDTNNDGVINARDLVSLRTNLLSFDIKDDSLDTNCDGKVNIIDLVRLKKYLAGDDVPLGAETA